MVQLLKGKPVADKIDQEILRLVEKSKVKGIIPTLAIVRVGEKKDDISYERGVEKKFQTLGINVIKKIFSENVSESIFVQELEKINGNKDINGILMFHPLPPQINEDAARNLISPQKDADGTCDLSLAGVLTGYDKVHAPCTAKAVIELLKFYDITLEGKNVVIVGRSLVVGRPLSLMMLKENATVTVCHSKTKDLEKVTKKADIVVAALGKPELLGADFFSQGQIVIDVGINWSEKKQRLVGDVNFEEVSGIVKAITPVPGGIGGITTSVLGRNLLG